MTSVAKIIVIGAMIAVASAKPASGLEAGEQQQPADRASCFTNAYIRKWCADQVDVKNICDGSKEDCLAKGKSRCSADSGCEGVMWNEDWGAALKGVKFCTNKQNLVQKQKRDWETFLTC